MTEEDDTETSNIMSRLERHNKVKGDIEKVAENVREIILSVTVYRTSVRPQWRQVITLTFISNTRKYFVNMNLFYLLYLIF